MIISFRDGWLQAFFLSGRSTGRVPADIEERLLRKIQMLDDATCDLDLGAPPSNHFEKLRGNLAGWHSVRVNQRWRLVFKWSGAHGEASEVYLDDHSYR